jgi:hypothetical protein
VYAAQVDRGVLTSTDWAIGMFELPKDDKRRKLWTIRVNRRISFNRIALLSRLCAIHFTNELFVVNNLFGDSIGHKIKKLV